MYGLTRWFLRSGETGPALRTLRSWTPADVPRGGLHPGDVGWHLRVDNSGIYYWTGDDGPLAVGILTPTGLRMTTAPGAELDRLTADVADLFEAEQEWAATLEPAEPSLIMSWAPQALTTRAERVGEETAADRALIHREAFGDPDFTVARWRRMKASPAGDAAVETLVRTPSGAPAAAATGWFAGPGRCGLVQPVGTRPEYRGRGYARDALLGTCAALIARGASAVAAVPPAANPAATALFRSAGFTTVRDERNWIW